MLNIGILFRVLLVTTILQFPCILKGYSERKCETYDLSLESILDFTHRGHGVLRGVLPDLSQLRGNFLEAKNSSDLLFYNYVLEKMGCNDLVNEKTLKRVRSAKKAVRKCKKKQRGVKFPRNQNINIHRIDENIYEVATSEYLGKLAASLLQVESVRLYKTALFLKDPAKDPNQSIKWQRDCDQVPVDTSNYVTFWCPLLPIDYQDSILEFATGEHRDMSNRHWYTNEPVNLDGYLRERYKIEHHAPFQVGDCSVHSGWIYYGTNPNLGQTTREAVTFSYIDANANKLHSNAVRLSRVVGEEDLMNWKDWLHSIPDFGVIDTPFLPIVYSQTDLIDTVFGTVENERQKNKKHRGDKGDYNGEGSQYTFGNKVQASTDDDEAWLDQDEDDWFEIGL